MIKLDVLWIVYTQKTSENEDDKDDGGGVAVHEDDNEDELIDVG